MTKYLVSASATTDYTIIIEANSPQEAEQLAISMPTAEWQNTGYEFFINYSTDQFTEKE